MEPINIYLEKLETLKLDLSTLKKKSSIWSYIRISIFIGGFAIITFLSDQLSVKQLSVLALIIFVLLILSVLKHLAISKNIDAFQKLIKINENEISILNQESNFYDEGKPFAIQYADLSNDLDLFGPQSVFHLLNRASTFFGIRKLKNFLLEFNSKEVIIERQIAVAELSKKLKWRQGFQRELIDIKSDNNYSSLIDFVKSSSFVEQSKSLFKFIFYQNVFMITLYIASLFLFSKYSFFIFIVIFVVNSFINLKFFARTNIIHLMVSSNAKDLYSFSNALSMLEGEKWNSTLLRRLLSENSNFSVEILSLKKLIQFFDYRLNMFMGTILNIFFLWDLRIIDKLDDWKNRNADIEKHFEILGEFEALTSFASLHFNKPNFAFGEISEQEFEIATANMLHPLISTKDAIANAYSFNGRSKLDIITGPNMSGKSTFLRSVAINMILAGAGSIVYADKFVFTPSKVLTYLHITDSVKDKISTFRAEIIKLKSILNDIETSAVPTFFILDEILRGTNSHSKFKGSVAIVKKLIELKSSGIIATHDVQLGNLEKEFPNQIRNFSFDFIVDANEELVYDYKLKSGINTKVNAEIVLKELGLVL